MRRRRPTDAQVALADAQVEVRLLRARLGRALDLLDEVMADKREALDLVETLREEQRAVRSAMEAAVRAAAEPD